MSYEFLEKESEAPINQDILKSLQRKVMQAEELAKIINENKELLLEYEKTYRQYMEQDIPELLQQCHMTTLKFEDGSEVSYKKEVSATLPKVDLEKRSRALLWLQENGASGIVKQSLIVEDEVSEARKTLTEKGVPYSVNTDVHPQTLLKFFRDILGLKDSKKAMLTLEEIPEEFNLYQYNKTIIKKGETDE